MRRGNGKDGKKEGMGREKRGRKRKKEKLISFSCEICLEGFLGNEKGPGFTMYSLQGPPPLIGKQERKE